MLVVPVSRTDAALHTAQGPSQQRQCGPIGSLRVVDKRWLSRRALSLHLTVAIVVPGFLALTAWQVDRAITGNTLSWVYSFEWPFFAGYAVFLWWRLLHEDSGPHVTAGAHRDAAEAPPEAPTDARRVVVDEPDQAPARAAAETGAGGATPAESQDPPPVDDELEAYNRYLAALNESGKRKRW